MPRPRASARCGATARHHAALLHYVIYQLEQLPAHPHLPLEGHLELFHRARASSDDSRENRTFLRERGFQSLCRRYLDDRSGRQRVADQGLEPFRQRHMVESSSCASLCAQTRCIRAAAHVFTPLSHARFIFGVSPAAADMAHRGFETAVEHQRAGRLGLAEQCYAAVPEGDPSYGNATFLRASIALAQQRGTTAIELFQKALALDPKSCAYRSGMAEAYRRLGSLALAFDQFEAVLQQEPRLGEAAFRLGLLLEQLGALEPALACYEHACELFAESSPDSSRAVLERLEVARSAFLAGLPTLSQEQSRASDLLVARAWLILAHIYAALERPELAVLACRRALGHAPSHEPALLELAQALTTAGQFTEAGERFRQLLQRDPRDLDALLGLAHAFKESGQLSNAMATLRQALQVKSTGGIHSLLLSLFPYAPEVDDRTILEEARIWDRKYAQPEALRGLHFPNARDAERRLRVGYVSEHFCHHVDQLFLPPLLTHHDRRAFEVILYSYVEKPDTETHYLQQLAHGWRNVAGWMSDKVATLIREDQIDVLVDLSLHTRGNRLLVFARKPAPVQLTWLAHAGTSGLSAMDYRITDPYLDPEGTDLSVYAERSLSLPDSYWCYQPRASHQLDPRLGPRAGPLTFGSLNSFQKFNPAVLALWAELLRSLPESQLLLLAPPGDARRWTLHAFEQQGVQPARIRFEWRKSIPDYLATFHEIDVCLDPFPYPGGATSLDAFWMGVPVVTLRGKTVVGRGGVSIAMNLGLPELVADTPADYLRIAHELASDEARLAKLRSTLRQRMLRSPLMDAPRFAANMEELYRLAWRTWLSAAGQNAGLERRLDDRASERQQFTETSPRVLRSRVGVANLDRGRQQ